ncbi:hypothetical protein PR048_021916 [Dryococelus australis]|uniref:Reverse transcriptase domain-containing protein n=1 Tax=Dryococelus australis TaxID=614101 RepID=A0ABQ9GZT5_9NEOP|nr:hypothetical protein PR048_021916 [Dryococelus australis]
MQCVRTLRALVQCSATRDATQVQRKVSSDHVRPGTGSECPACKYCVQESISARARGVEPVSLSSSDVRLVTSDFNCSLQLTQNAVRFLCLFLCCSCIPCAWAHSLCTVPDPMHSNFPHKCTWWEASSLTAQQPWPEIVNENTNVIWQSLFKLGAKTRSRQACITYSLCNSTRLYLLKVTDDELRVWLSPFSYQATPGFSHVGIVPDESADDRQVFSEISPPFFFIPALLHSHLTSPSLALKTSLLRATQISSFSSLTTHLSSEVTNLTELMPVSICLLKYRLFTIKFSSASKNNLRCRWSGDQTQWSGEERVFRKTRRPAAMSATYPISENPDYSTGNLYPVLPWLKANSLTATPHHFHRLNLVTRSAPPTYIHVKDALNTLGRTKVLTTTDLCSGYWQIPAKPEDRHKTAFFAPNGRCFQFCTMPLGLKCAPAMFQSVIVHILDGLVGESAIAYLDDTDLQFLGHVRPNVRFKWSDAQDSVVELKRCFRECSTLARYDPTHHLHAQTDMSEKRLGVVVFQLADDGTCRIIDFGSAKFGPVELCYDINERGCLAIVWSLKKYCQLLEFQQFILRMDMARDEEELDSVLPPSPVQVNTLTAPAAQCANISMLPAAPMLFTLRKHIIEHKADNWRVVNNSVESKVNINSDTWCVYEPAAARNLVQQYAHSSNLAPFKCNTRVGVQNSSVAHGLSFRGTASTFMNDGELLISPTPMRINIFQIPSLHHSWLISECPVTGKISDEFNSRKLRCHETLDQFHLYGRVGLVRAVSGELGAASPGLIRITSTTLEEETLCRDNFTHIRKR